MADRCGAAFRYGGHPQCLTPITRRFTRQETDAQYAALADRIEAQVNSIVANCHLPAAADANLHYVIADLSGGVARMRGQDPARTRLDGAALVHGALIAYGKYFEDPDWVAEQAMKH
jgi:hypothetical protein